MGLSSSMEALGRAVDRIKTLRVLLIVTYRPEFQAPWIGLAHLATLTVNRLGAREIAVMIDSIAGNKPLSASTRLDIIERTDGVPLFVEEVTKAVLEIQSGGDTGAGGRCYSFTISVRPRKPPRLTDGSA